MKLIVGLGNPGREYENTRHNIGFMVLDHFTNEQFKEKFNGLYAKTLINGEQVILLKPLSYMNLSGTVVRKFVDYFNIKIEDILVIQDDLDMPFAKIRLRKSGSCGGHNGIRNIIDNLGTQDIKRLKVGIAHNRDIDTKDYVLSKFDKESIEKLNNLFKTTDNLLNDFLTLNFDLLMNRYNGENHENI